MPDQLKIQLSVVISLIYAPYRLYRGSQISLPDVVRAPKCLSINDLASCSVTSSPFNWASSTAARILPTTGPAEKPISSKSDPVSSLGGRTSCGGAVLTNSLTKS